MSLIGDYDNLPTPFGEEPKKGTLWQPAYYDHALRKEDNHKEIARYIVANPLRGGLVKSLGDYPHWDSIWLE
nr:hypothetical protein [Thiolapillus sp.]